LSPPPTYCQRVRLCNVALDCTARHDTFGLARTCKNRVKKQKSTRADKFWIFVDIGPQRPEYYIAPAWWVQNDIHVHHAAYLAKHGGKRARGGRQPVPLDYGEAPDRLEGLLEPAGHFPFR
jgi:hypothetical protein